MPDGALSDRVKALSLGSFALSVLAGIIAFITFVPVVACPNVLCIQYREVASESMPECPICKGSEKITLLKRWTIRQDLRLPVWK